MHFHTIVAMYFFRRYSLRPKTDPYCRAGVIPFCPTGEPANAMPQFVDTDQIEVYALKKPVWQFKFGDLMGKFVSKIRII